MTYFALLLWDSYQRIIEHILQDSVIAPLRSQMNAALNCPIFSREHFR